MPDKPETFTPVFAGQVRRGRLEVGDPEFQRWLAALEGKTIEVIVQEPYQRRSLPANAYYHFVIRLISDRTGYTEKEAHEEMRRFLPVGVESTKQLSRQQFREYLEMVIYFAGWLEIDVPPARRVAVAA